MSKLIWNIKENINEFQLNDPTINKLVGGSIRNDDLILISGKSKVGKTSFLVNLISAVPLLNTENILYIDMANGAKLLQDKLILVDKSNTKKNIYIQDEFDIHNIESVFSERKYKLIIVNYLDLITNTNFHPKCSDKEEIKEVNRKEITRVIKQWINIRKIPVILVNRL
ncbi:MAG: hypothetical protein Ta2E_06350 [Mycoplasmoidaceae bacterium]|nr:MAG: hypothetical protein Ta2E_06350 [Mycoplasmoidaceae bacterium]